MKIKKEEYNRRIAEAFKAGLKIGIENPEYARFYLLDEHIQKTTSDLAKRLSNVSSRVSELSGGEE